MAMADDGTMALDSDDLAALRLADRVVFQTLDNGESAIRAIVDRGMLTDTPIYSAREQRLFPETERYSRDRERTIRVRATGYGYGDATHNMGGWSGGKFSAFHMHHHARMTEEWCTLADLMRVGDTVTLRWVANNGNGNTKDAGLVVDELRLTLNLHGKRERTFLVDVSVGRDDSARMIKRYG